MLAGPAADDDYVVVVYSGGSSPDCSRTMYSAYQSGQFGSACPVRDSCCPCAAAARRSACDRSLADADVVSPATRPGSRVVISWNSQPLPPASQHTSNHPTP